MVETDVLQKLFRAFPNSVINHSLEFVADVNPRVNSYFCLLNCNSEEDVQAKVLEWLSRDAYKSTHYRTNKKNEEAHKYHLDGQRFGKLAVLRRNENATMALNHPVFDCRCDCGREITAYGHDLRKGKKTSCGCDKKTPKSDFADFARRHGCSVCADKKDCDMTFCKYEKELTS